MPDYAELSFIDHTKEANQNESKKSTHSGLSTGIWEKVERLRKTGTVFLDGSNLDIASVIAVAKYNCDAYIEMSEDLVDRMDGSVKLLEEYLSKGYCVYGVNTGFGGSADSRTADVIALQSALLQLTQAGILTDMDGMAAPPNVSHGFHSMPVTWVRATMLIRCNNALRGHSGVRLKILEGILQLLRKKMTPIVPLRGSISASGDLMPLSYIAGILEGNPDIHVRVTNGLHSKVITSTEALAIADLEPFILGPKEGLALINGTAASASVACLAAVESNKLALLAQILTAMSCEALLGNAESYHPFIAAAQPHPGQIECSSNLLTLLQGSSLVETMENQDKRKAGLFQDRYALRGTPQWLGPQLEDLSAVLGQLTVELNSTSDNPIIDVKKGEVYSGANFIASSVSSGMEKTRLSLQIIGKLLFSLSSELIDPAMNRGLPPNLSADNPSLSFTMKGIDISMAAYMSELAYLANPVTSHVQSAETNNQSINSLALVSSRYTIQAAEIVAMMCASHLFVVCQALDLRALHLYFLQDLKKRLPEISNRLVPQTEIKKLDAFQNDLFRKINESWNTSSRSDLEERYDFAAEAGLAVLIFYSHEHSLDLPAETTKNFQRCLRDIVRSSFANIRDDFIRQPMTTSLLGRASKRLYNFVREDLGVPFHQGLIEHPTREPTSGIGGRPKKTIGSWVSIIFNAIYHDKIWRPIVDVFQPDI